MLVVVTWPRDDEAPAFDSGYLHSITGKISDALPDWSSSAKQQTEESTRIEFVQDDGIGVDMTPPLASSQNIFPGCSNPDINEDVAICIVARNQSEDLKEWFRHHYHHLGIRRFYVMDDRTVPPLSETSDYTIPHSHITFIYHGPDEPYPSNRQWYSYNTCQSRFGHLHKWIGYIDADEFLEIRDRPGMSIAEFLAQYEDDLQPAQSLANPNITNVGAFGINWQVHNSNNHLHRQPSTRAAYTSCIWDGPDPNGEDSHNAHIKSFVRTAYFDNLATVHNFHLNSSKVTVGEYGDVVETHLRTPITRDRIVLHHYTIKSKEDFEEKLHRGDVQDNPRNWWWWDKYELSLRADCPQLARYFP
jgi:hypothetical protein